MSFTSSSDLVQPSDTTTVASGGSFSSLSSPVTVVNLCHKNLSSIDLIRMAEQFTIESTVHTLRLGFNDFGDAGAKTVANLLNRYHSITCLDLGFCNIGDIGIEALASHLSLSSCRIEILYLSGNRLTPLGLKHLSNALSTNSSIQRLYLTANEGGPDGAKWIAKGLGSNHSLTSLTINVNKMGSAGADAIADMLAKNDSLTHLNLSDNNIGDDGMISISKSAGNHKQLKELELSFNKISPIGMSSFLDHTIEYQSLTRLFLDNNKISDAGAQSLSQAIPRMQLSELNVSFNEIGTLGLISIIQCVQSSLSIKKLWLSGNAIDNDAAKAVATMLLKNCALHTLYMDNCSISTMGERFIGTGIASNKKSSLRLLTGFELAKVLVLLGSPPQIGELSNEAALRYLNQMWQHVEKTTAEASPSSPHHAGGPSAGSSASGVVFNTISSNIANQSSVASLPKRPSTESVRSPHSSTRLQSCGVTQESALTEGGETVTGQDENEFKGDAELDSDESNSDDESYYTSDESCYSRASTNSAYELNYDYPEDEEVDAMDHEKSSDPPRNFSSASLAGGKVGHSTILPSTSTKSIQSLSRGNIGSKKRHHSGHHHHHSSPEYDDSQKTEHRLRTYIVNPEVLDVAKKICTIPFSSVELWELHQYYYSPPPSTASYRNMTNALDLANKRGSMSDLSCHSYITHSSSHGRTLTESNNDGDEIKRPHKKQSNVRTMARINLYSRIKHVLESYTSVGDDIKTLLLLRRLRYIEDCSGIYDTSTVESILIDDIMEEMEIKTS